MTNTTVAPSTANVASDGSDYEREWTRPVHLIGRISLIGVCISTFLPILYLYFVHDIMPPMDLIIKNVVIITTAFGFIWLIEPIFFYPALGIAGCYQAFLTGNIGTSKLPASAVAQDLTKVEPGSLEAEVISSFAIIGSICTTVGFVALGAVAGTAILDSLSPPVLAAVKSFTVPAVFGALMVQFAIKYPKIIPVAIGVPLFLRVFLGGILPGYLFIIITIASTIAAALYMYQGQLKKA
ncbi:hypothetical protein [Vibrio diabolicus]|uniref:Uncharacterized protein n=1 Tax=Vibrio diabolicus TaxID=50719 RepID=A0AA92LPJ2_9VIBR|nr:hypothetical protein [Vibrio diabolicus]QRG81483.1 hypothetical protein JOS67_00485 [Vibrio diabolicus]